MNRQLGQLRPTDTSAASIYTPAAQVPYEAKLIVVCNVSALPANASVYHDDNGTTYDETTALLHAHTLAAGETVFLEGPFSGYRAAGNIAVKTSVNNAINFTVYGEVENEKV